MRWNDRVTDARRTTLEQQLHLTAGHLVDGMTWAYTLDQPSTGTIRAVVQHDEVADTEHVNRLRFRPAFAYDRSRRVIVFAVAIGGVCALLLATATALPLLGIQIQVTGQSLAALVVAPPVMLFAAAGGVLLMAAAGWQPLWRGETALTLPGAAAAADRVLVARMIAGGSNPDAAAHVDLESHPDAVLTPLEAAILSRDLDTATLLVKSGARVDAGNRLRLVCLSIDVGARDIADYLDAGANVPSSRDACTGVDLPVH